MYADDPMQQMLQYLADLAAHNQREWYHAHREERQAAQTTFLSFLQGLLFTLGEEEPDLLWLDPKDLTYRLPRDVRLYRNRPPYRPSFRANLSPKGKVPIPCGYFLCLRPGGRSFVGGGLFSASFREATLRIRAKIDEEGDRWEALVNDPAFADYTTLEGERLKNVPREYPPFHPQGPYLKYKSFYAKCFFSDETVLAEYFMETLQDRIRRLRPLNAFLNEALEGYEMPQWE